MGNRVYFAHSNELDKASWQTLHDHLVNTARIASGLGMDSGLSDLAYIAALLHDIGKYSHAFQRRLDGSRHRVDHATAGAREARNLFQQNENQKLLATILAYCIAGHHSGLPDYGSEFDVETDNTLLARRDKKRLEDFSAYKTDIDPASLTLPARLAIRPLEKHVGFSLSFLTRML
ncbi:MAG: CRISPR-associated endonuclease Cas3'', partial [Anaerolineaceae bacterium]|nr:CRISPR-associated endonuclease Cas3'' [Anaerolineaceae bacterium]